MQPTGRQLDSSITTLHSSLNLFAHKENTGDKYGADLVKEVSPVAWQHINLYGRYEFREQPAPVDVEEIVRVLADIQIETDSSLAA